MSEQPTHVRPDGRRVVVAAAVARGGHLLAARRTRPESLAGGWELPGGKVEPGEQPASALARELREELALEVDVVGTLRGPDDGDWPLDDAAVLRVLRCVPRDGGEPVPGVAHDAYRWLRADALDEVGWLAADLGPATAAAARLGTVVTFPGGALVQDARVVRVEPYAEGVAVLTDRTPFHPIDDGWPDQGADSGTLEGRPVRDVRIGTVDDDGVLQVGADVDVRRGDPARSWVVVHLLDGAPADLPERVRLVVDEAPRRALSAGHTACHLAALALNEACADLWSKDGARRDSRGHPDLDQLTVQVSRIEPFGAYDRYRWGRSARKAGLDVATLLDQLAGRRAVAQQLLDGWVASGATVRVDDGGDPTLAGRRTWVCALPGPPARLPCGGTHVAGLAELDRVRVEWTATVDEPGLEVRTRTTARPAP